MVELAALNQRRGGMNGSNQEIACIDAGLYHAPAVTYRSSTRAASGGRLRTVPPGAAIRPLVLHMIKLCKIPFLFVEIRENISTLYRIEIDSPGNWW